MYSFSPVEYSGGFVGVALHGTLIPQGIAGVTSNTLLKWMFARIAQQASFEIYLAVYIFFRHFRQDKL